VLHAARLGVAATSKSGPPGRSGRVFQTLALRENKNINDDREGNENTHAHGTGKDPSAPSGGNRLAAGMLSLHPNIPPGVGNIFPTLRLIDGISPGMASDPASGSFCVIMPCRCVAEEVGVGKALAPGVAA